MIAAPAPRPRSSRAARVALGSVLAVCGLVIAANLALWIGVRETSPSVDADRPHALRAGSIVFLANTSARKVECTLTGDGVPQVMLIPASPGFPVQGQVAGRLPAGPMRLTCDGQVRVLSGPLVFAELATGCFWMSIFVILVIGYVGWRRTRSFAVVSRLWQVARYSLRQRRLR